MDKLYNIITTKEKTLESLQQEKSKLQEDMANPRVIQNNAQEIDDTKRAIKLLCDASSLAEETLSEDINPNEVLRDMIDHLEEVKNDVSDNKDKSNLDKDIQIIKDIMVSNNDSSDIVTDVDLPDFDEY